MYLAHVSAKMITIEECVISSISCAQKYLEHSGDETQSIIFVWCCGGARIGERICIVWTTNWMRCNCYGRMAFQKIEASNNVNI